MKTRSLWIGFIAVVTLSFAVLLFFGREIYRQGPPIPEQVVTTSGEVLFTGAQIRDGQNVWQSTGGQEPGLMWGRQTNLAMAEYSGGIPGTFHHLYFTGTPTGVLALGATFSALEGALCLAWFIFGLKLGWSVKK